MSLLDVISLGISLVTFSFMLFDVVWMETRFFPRAYKPILFKLTLLPGLFALANGVAATLPRSAVFLSDIATVCRVTWIFYFLQSYLVNFNPKGFGGAAANRHFTGEILDKANFPQSFKGVLPWFVRLMGIKYPPDSIWLKSCIGRVKFYVSVRILVVVARQIASDYDLLYDDSEDPKVLERIFNWGGLLATLVGVSGFIPANYVFSRIVTPERRPLLAIRQKTFLFFMPFQSFIQRIIFIAAPSIFSRSIQHFIIAIEMLVMQFLCHRCFVPLFKWTIPSPAITPDQVQEIIENGFSFTVPVGEMANALAGRDKTEYEIVDVVHGEVIKKK